MARRSLQRETQISALPEVRHVARSSVHQELMINRAPYHCLQRVTIADHFSHFCCALWATTNCYREPARLVRGSRSC
ncbi:predicted protein [Botrytis cinerea T4]|uniref:Uncharacterized protein n=1 Tax=Botryotinia fuckeliana (strain T4) TaxID=999810 RepID=G2YFQ7_BOTF4|nr:predicted protein [Botrytis cinerea T4]